MGLTLKSYGPPPDSTLKLLSMKETYNNKTQRVNVTQYDPNYLLSTKKTGGQREEGHGVVHHIHGEYHQTYLLQKPLSKCQHPGWTNSVQDEPV